MGFWTRFFGKQETYKVPILGIDASGKTCLAWGLGNSLAWEDWGGPTEDTADYFDQITPNMLRGAPLDATIGNHAMGFHFKKLRVASEDPLYARVTTYASRADRTYVREVSDSAPGTCEIDLGSGFEISTYDISGGDFREAAEVFKGAASDPMRNKAVRSFVDLLSRSSGLIVVVDLARRITTRDGFQNLARGERHKHLLDSLAEQVYPICVGVREAIRSSNGMAGKPIIFTFTKSDIHGHSQAELEKLITSAYAILLERLRREGVVIRVCCTAYRGIQVQDSLQVTYQVEGVRELLGELAMFRLENQASKER